uniref:glycosyltransferase n=1 Tax=Roseivirga sp. TaxID=1964215 RepID=UPI004047CD01
MIPKLSIIVPTKNRYTCLYSCIQSLLDYYDTGEVEILIHDNSTEPMPDYCRELFDNSRVNYVYHEGWLAASENFDKAIGLARGEYLTMIGDDDSVSSKLLDAINWMDQNGVKALSSPFAVYLWPDTSSRLYGKAFAGTLSVEPFSSKVKEIDVAGEIEKCLEVGGTSLCDLPKMYYGIIHRSLIDMVYEQSGYYIPGPSPDMANALSMAYFCDKMYFVDYPLFIAGNSGSSAAGLGSKGKHIGAIEEVPFLPKNSAEIWNEDVPRFWSGPTVWSESASLAITSLKMDKELGRMNYLYLYAKCLVFHSDYKTEIRRTLKNLVKKRNKSMMMSRAYVARIYCFTWMLRFKSLFLNVSTLVLRKIGVKGNSQLYREIDDVRASASKFAEVLNQAKVKPFWVK